MITPSFNLTATERVLPSMALDFTTANLDSRVTFTRSGGTATYTDSNGYVASAGVDVPRFDYDPVALACKGLLIEEARTNLFTYSSDYTNDWTLTKFTSFGTTTSPDNTNTGYKLVPNTDSATHSVSQTIALTSGTTYTFSVYAKAAEKTNLQLRISTTNDIQITFNVDTGEINSTVAGTGTITDVGNGWYRCTATATCTSTASLALRIYVAEGDNTTLTFAGNDSDGLYIWGAQLEVGAFATSYIPTVASQVTRTADVATMTGTDFSDWYNASEGTISTTLQSLPNAGLGAGRAVCINNATAANSLISAWVSTTMRSRLVVGGATQFQFISGADPTNQNNICTAYKVNDFAASFNAASVLTDTLGSLWTPTQMSISSDGAGATNVYSGHIKKILYWPQRLTNNEVQATSKG